MMEMPWKSALKLWLCPQHQGVRDGLIATEYLLLSVLDRVH